MPIHNTGPKSHTGSRITQAPAVNTPDGKRLGMQRGQVGKLDTQNNSAGDRARDRKGSR